MVKAVWSATTFHLGDPSGEADHAPSRPHQEQLDVTVGKDAQSGLERSDINKVQRLQ
jgi:hypothetical protein